MSGRTLIFLVLLFIWTCTCHAKNNHRCNPSSCGNNTIRNPFRLKTDPMGCGYPEYGLSCENNRTVLYLDEGKYFVQSINYDNFTIRIVDAGLLEGNCSSMPYSSFQCYRGDDKEYSCNSSYYNKINIANDFFFFFGYYDIGEYVEVELSRNVAYVECASEIDSPFYAKASPCVKSQNSSSAFPHINRHPYIVDAHNVSCLEVSCRIRSVSRISWPGSKSFDQLSYEEIHEELVYGFELSWLPFLCKRCNHSYRLCALGRENHEYKSRCYGYYGGAIFYIDTLVINLIEALFIWTREAGSVSVAIFLIYKWTTRHRAADENIEEFLQNQKMIFPIRYSYSNIKKIARNFKDRLGEGGYGFVYKGKLRSGQDVAIKILKNTKANGQDFINEVATIGRVHHVNVVRLIGFCVEGSKRALVYDFMPNGSLDKHIFCGENGTSLGCKEIYEISLGVARGIEYLHGGCGMQILHFDIKPHNILLDKNFIPKISDFGLAKLYPTSYNTVSLTAARGTLGYMAPELVYKTIGRVSYKADVYSFGKLLMEMAGRRKNVDATMERSSQVYLPSWVYDQLTKGNNIETVDFVEEEEREITTKMMIVALWCVQMNPNDRPSMHEVLKMLEGLGNLPMPHKPLLHLPEVPNQISNTNANFELLESSFVSSSLGPYNIPDNSGDIIEEISLV